MMAADVKKAVLAAVVAPGDGRLRWGDAFLSAIQRHGTISGAADEIGKHRSTVYEAFASAPEFRAEVDRVLARGDAVEEVARRLAIEGVEEPVFYRGKVVGVRPRHFPSLIRHLSNANRGARRARDASALPVDPATYAEATCNLLDQMAASVPTPVPLRHPGQQACGDAA